MNKTKSVSQAFSSTGPLAKAINGFNPRQAQLDMSLEVEQVIADKETLLVEAGTGTGKTFAYLVPAFLSEQKTIVSTGTKTLQEQLFHKDLPLVKKALGSKLKIALLKGRSNYLCTYRLEENFSSQPHKRRQAGVQLDAAALADLVKVRQWSSHTQSGDLGELTDVAEDSAIFAQVTSTTDNCLGRQCPDYETCYLVKARERAIEADVLVVNHHLFFADLALKDTGFGELIPSAQTIIFDEAHQIPDIATEYFGQSFSSRQLLDLASDCMQQYRTELTDVKQLSKAAEKLQRSAADFRLLFGQNPERGDWRQRLRMTTFKQGFNHVVDDLKFLYEVLKLCVSRTEAIDNCFERATQLLNLCDLMQQVDKPGTSLWYETTRRHITLHLTPLSVADKFSEVVSKSNSAWVFTSATLAVDGQFEHFSKQLGLANAKSMLLDSPFDYADQSLLLVPRYLPEAQAHNRAQALVDIAMPLIAASEGRCFMLFTSYRMLNQVAQILTEAIENPLLVQGQMAKRVLLDHFIDQPDSVLLATASFWEGVDVRGNNLTCVIIDKLPFASPDDPLLQAKSADVKSQGKDPFAQIQLPQAVIALKQGVGRLIRDIDDRGVMAICDARLVNRHYGQVFLNSLPDMQRTRELKRAVTFLEAINR